MRGRTVASGVQVVWDKPRGSGKKHVQKKRSGGVKQPGSITASSRLSLVAIHRRKLIKRVIESRNVTILLITISIWSLFANDIKVMLTSKDADRGFDAVISVIFFLFLFEILVNSYYKDDYFQVPYDQEEVAKKSNESDWRKWLRRVQVGSFYFWLDTVATFSLVVEMEWLVGDQNTDVHSSQRVYQQVGYALRAGARASRVVRLLRLIKVRHLWDRLFSPPPVQNISNEIVVSEITPSRQIGGDTVIIASRLPSKKSRSNVHVEAPVKSRVGTAMTDLMNQRVVILVILMLVVIPMLTAVQTDSTKIMALKIIHGFAISNYTDSVTYGPSLLSSAQDVVDITTNILSIQINDRFLINKLDVINKRRVADLSSFFVVDGLVTTRIVFDDHTDQYYHAMYSACTTLFVTFVLLVGMYFFSSDVNKLIINPIERLVDLVRKISANPLGVEYKMLGAKEGFMPGMETTILLTTINRIGGLMQVGFGEAGASMIAKNLADSSGGQLNFMGGGTMIKSIFGFCDVRQFTDTTECLQEEVMLFVNRIAFILHDIVVQCSGAANKNIGDAFLLAWKLDDRMQEWEVTALADQALVAFCKTLVELSRYQRFICNFSPAATERLAKRFPDYEVRIGSGLHVGWAIEGAIGSNRKIDASYLSPHVNFTEFLESSTKEYGVPLLFSEPFYNLLSPHAKKYCRQVDRIRRSLGEDPVGLFIYDSDINIDWNDKIRRARRATVNTIAGRNHHRNQRKSVDVNASTIRGRKSSMSRVNFSGWNEESSLRRNLALSGGSGGGPRVDFQPVRRPHGVDKRERGRHNSASMSMFTLAIESRTVESRNSRVSSMKENEAADSALGSPDVGSKNSSIASASGGGFGAAVGAGISTRRKTSFDDEFDIENALSSIAIDHAVNMDPDEAPKIVIPRYASTVWEYDQDLVEMRHLITDVFRQQWDQGIQAYIKGDWQKARDIFHGTVSLSNGKEDGPSKFLIRIIDHHGGTRPADWSGYRMDDDGGH